MIHSTIPNLIIARVYFADSYSTGNHLQGIFIGNSRKEVNKLIREEYAIKEGTLTDWVNRNHWDIDYDKT